MPVPDERGDRLVRLATIGAVAWNVALPARFAWQLLDYGELNLADGLGCLACAVLSTLLVLRGVRVTADRISGVLLAALAVVLISALPFSGPLAALVLAAVAGFGLIVLRRPWSVLLFAAVVAVAEADAFLAPMPTWPGMRWYHYEFASYDPVIIGWTGIAVAVLVRLARNIRELQEARRQLAERALVVERQCIDDQLAETIGAALQLIIADAQAAARLAGDDPHAAARLLKGLTTRSRTVLADARSMLTGYRSISLFAELRAVTTLLAAAGIDADVKLPDARLPRELPGPLQSRLRAAAAQALADGTAGQCVLIVSSDRDGEFKIQLVQKCAFAGEVAR